LLALVLNLSWAVSDPLFIDYNLYRGVADIRNDRTEYGFNFYRAIRAGPSPFNEGQRFDTPDERHRIRQEVISQWKQVLREHPGEMLKKRIRNLYGLWIYRGDFFFTESIGLSEAIRSHRWGNLFLKLVFYILYSLLPMVLAAAGTWMAMRKREWRACLLLWLYPIIITLMMIPLSPDHRYDLPSHALLAPLVALALIQIFSKWKKVYSREPTSTPSTIGHQEG
jgi:hypothetical protein